MKRVFDTGKVRIGLAYEPKIVYPMSDDMLHLQRVLLNGPRKWHEKPSGLWIIGGIFYATMLLLVTISGLLWA